MAVKNSLVSQSKKQPFGAYLTQDAVKKRVSQVIGGKDGQRFITAIVSAVTVNPQLAECDHGSILSAALLGESLKLSPSPQLGQYYIVPFKDRKNGRTVATFQLGYKGYIQLAVRSGYYKHINVVAIKEGELLKYNPLNEEIEVSLVPNDAEREKLPAAGYYAMFEYINGFRKAMYWSREKMEAHALRYSQGYAADRQKGTQYTFWSKDFDGMAYKTMLRQLIGKWGIMSIELQNAVEGDMAVISDDGNIENYTDNEAVVLTTAEEDDPDETKDGSASEPDDYFEGTPFA